MPPTVSGLWRKALLGSAFCFLALGVVGRALASECSIKQRDVVSRVRSIVDGDTVILGDGRHVRFIGINAPELAHDDHPAQPLAEAARATLVKRLAGAGNRLVLQVGAERKDRYGRLLAHPFLSDGTNLSADLLRGGWGEAIAVPPNLAFQSCYRAAEQAARGERRGVWGDAYYAPRDAATLDARAAGFMRVRGRLEQVGFSRNALWLQIGRLGVRIDKSNLHYFRHWNFHDLRGRELEVRGWVGSYRQRLRMSLKHPNDLALPNGVSPAR